MTLQAPQLDDRTFQQLVEEARSRIPRFTPQWTNLNDSDPGMTLVKLHAWLTETILYRLNQVPDLNYIKFLDLLNIRPRPATAATAQLSFKLRKLDKPTDPLVIDIPQRTQVAVNDPDLQQELIFETDLTHRALNAARAAIVVPVAAGDDSDQTTTDQAATMELVTEFDTGAGDASIRLPFYPFGQGDAATAGSSFLIGMVLRPRGKDRDQYQFDLFPEGELDLTVFTPDVFEIDASGQVHLGPNSDSCLLPHEAGQSSTNVAWEVYVGSEQHDQQFIQIPADNQMPTLGVDANSVNSAVWRPLAVSEDQTAGLVRTGHVRMTIPSGVALVPFDKLNRLFWSALGLTKAPTTSQELINDIENGQFDVDDVDEAVWEQLGITSNATPSMPPDELLEPDVQVLIEAVQNAGVTGAALALISEADWQDLGLVTAPMTADQLVTAIATGQMDLLNKTIDDLDLWSKLGLAKPELGDESAKTRRIRQAGSYALDFDQVTQDQWGELGYDPPPVPYKLAWFRVRLLDEPVSAPQVKDVLLNTAPATAAVTRFGESLGTSNGRPNQSFTLRRTPLLIDANSQPQLTLELRNGDQVESDWHHVEDFYVAPDDPDIDTARDLAGYLIDPDKGQITFGDGEHGRIPVAGTEIVAKEYRYGGGAIGNVGAQTITKLRSALSDVESVTNPRAAAGGQDVETQAQVRLRAPHDLRHRDRAVTAEDFADLAIQTPGVAIQRAFALPQTRLDQEVQPPAPVSDEMALGAVTVVVLPFSTHETPQPSEDQIRLVCGHLNKRRLITTELYVTGPRYLRIETLAMQVTVDQRFDLTVVRGAIVDQITRYLHPLCGGDDGQGWPFGQDIFFGNLYRQALGVEGVRRVLCLSVTPDPSSLPDTGDSQTQDDTGSDSASGGQSEACDDVVAVPDGALVHLPVGAIDVKVSYES